MSDISKYFDGGFKAEDHEEMRDDSPLPVGKYFLEIEKAEVKETKNGEGVGCDVQFNVIGHVDDQSHKGRKLFVWFNLRHSNEKAQKIGNAEFAALGRAIGKPIVQDSDELIGGTFIASVGIDKKDATRNVIKKYSSASGAQAATQTQTAVRPAPQAPAPAAAGGKKPWEM